MIKIASQSRYDDMQFFPFKYIELEEVDSTSLFLKEMLAKGELPPYSFCLTQKQTAGYGQYGKSWLSNPSSLIFSLSIPLNGIELHQLGCMSGVVALAIRDSLAKHSSGQPFQVKWPNDVYGQQGKVSGCLIEIVKSADDSEWLAVIGIGINRTRQEGEFEVDWVDALDEALFLSELSSQLVLCFQRLRENQTVFSMKSWALNDYFSEGEVVFVYDNGTQFTGLYNGVNDEGHVCITIQEKQKCYASGAVSIRKANKQNKAL